jgi:hypothetical protein
MPKSAPREWSSMGWSIAPEEAADPGPSAPGPPPQVGVAPMDVRLWAETLPSATGSRLASVDVSDVRPSPA